MHHRGPTAGLLVCHLPSQSFLRAPADTSFPDDVEVAKCMLDLHARQGSTCISVEGSECEYDYVPTGGVIKNIRKPGHWGGGQDPGSQRLSEAQLEASKEAVEWMGGQIVYVKGGNPAMFFYNNDEPSSYSRDRQWPRFWQIDYIHGHDC